MFCSQCGTQLSDDAKFCPNCGANMSASSPAQQPQPQPEQQPAAAPEAEVTTTEPVVAEPVVAEPVVAEPVVAEPSPQPQYTAPQQPQYSAPQPQYTNAPAAPNPTQIMIFGIIAAVLALYTGIGGIILGKIAQSKAALYQTVLGPLTGKAKVGAILGKVGFIAGIVMTVVYCLSFFLGFIIGLMGI